jgi:hypothetical protein
MSGIKEIRAEQSRGNGGGRVTDAHIPGLGRFRSSFRRLRLGTAVVTALALPLGLGISAESGYGSQASGPGAGRVDPTLANRAPR